MTLIIVPTENVKSPKYIVLALKAGPIHEIIEKKTLPNNGPKFNTHYKKKYYQIIQ